MFEHKSLLVTLCEKCKGNHYTKNQWHTADEWQDVDERGKCIYCEICGEGGTLMCCDKDCCKHSYCLACLEVWLTKTTLDQFLADDKMVFNCFVCTMKQGDGEMKAKFPVAYKFKQMTEKNLEIYKNIKKSPKKRASAVGTKKDKKSTSKKSKATVKEFKCYSCFKKHDYTEKKMPKLHTTLKVAMCQPCWKYLQSDDWTYSDGKSDYCIITGDG